jgi:hypothetical protein
MAADAPHSPKKLEEGLSSPSTADTDDLGGSTVHGCNRGFSLGATFAWLVSPLLILESYLFVIGNMATPAAYQKARPHSRH